MLGQAEVWVMTKYIQLLQLYCSIKSSNLKGVFILQVNRVSQVSFSTRSNKKPLRSGTGFYGPDIFPVIQAKETQSINHNQVKSPTDFIISSSTARF